jgi:hypothetical protein
MRSNQSAAANRRPAVQSNGSDNLTSIPVADRVFPAAAAGLDRHPEETHRDEMM